MTPKISVTLKDFPRGIANILKASEAMMRRNNQILAGQIRLTAKRSMKQAPRTVNPRDRIYSRPGEVPYARNGAVKNFVRYGYDQHTKVWVVGPEKLNYTGATPQSLETGEPTTISVRRGTTRQWVRIPFQARPFMRPAMAKIMTPDNIKKVYQKSLKPRGF